MKAFLVCAMAAAAVCWLGSFGHATPSKPSKSSALSSAENSSLQGRRVRIELNAFRCVDADEESAVSDGDEPYLMPVAIFADGTTINLSNLSAATVRLQRVNQVHGNLQRKGIFDGNCFLIPTATGRFDATMQPLTLGSSDLGQCGVLVIACEEDGTSDRAINAGYNTLVSSLQTELNAAVRTLSPPDVAQLTNRIRDRVVNKIKKETLKRLNVFGIVDPDGFVGSGFSQFTIPQLTAAGEAGVPINFDMRGDGVRYRIEGRASLFTPIAPRNVNVTIRRIRAIDDLEGFGAGAPDFKARIGIFGATFTTPERTGNDIRPNFSFTRTVDSNRVSIAISLVDVDGTSRDDRCDINPAIGMKDLVLNYNIATGQITGDVTGSRGVEIRARGAGDGNRCEIFFVVN